MEFDGLPAKIVRVDDVINVYYGGALAADGPGHGHIVAKDLFGGDIFYWRLPACEGGKVIAGEPRDTVSS